MIVDWLPEKAVANFSIVSGFLTWIVILFWLAKSGWRIQRRYFVEATRTPLGRNGIVWSSALMGAVFFVAGERRPGLPAILAVAMVGVLSAYVDALTHRLPNGYTAAMAVGVCAGLVGGALVSPFWKERLTGSALGVVIWLAPVWLLNRLPGGMGAGDVKLAPVLGAMVGSVGVEAAAVGLALAFVSAGVAALWKLVVGSAGTKSRVPMGPWMIGAALFATVAWGVIPDWL